MTRLPREFPPLRELVVRAADEYAPDDEHGAIRLYARVQFARLLSDLTRPESQAVWLRWLAGRLGVPVGAPQWEKSGVTGPGWCAYTLGTPGGLGTPGLSRWFQFGPDADARWVGPAIVCPTLPDPDSPDAPIRALVLAILTVGAS